jgi:hypothetical protein
MAHLMRENREMYAIVVSAGSAKGRVRSVHRGYTAADRAQPATFHALCKVTDGSNVRKGDMRPDLLDNAWRKMWVAA